jgi:D-alanine-D-alanine ligase
VPGRELTVGVMGDGALTVTEIAHTHAFFDYDAKYTEGHAVHTLPAQVPDEVAAEAMRLALLAHRTLGCRGISRTDFRWDDSKPGTAGLYFLEINTQPGFTPISLVPEQAKHVGVDFADLCEWLLEDAACGR